MNLDQYSTDEMPDYAKISTDLPTDEIIALTLSPAHEIYTQQDGEGGETIYQKEFRMVNRTGVFAWLPKHD